MTDQCPSCARPASATVEVSGGDSYRDALPKPPHSLVSTYVRMCAHPEESSRARQSVGQAVTVYFHTRSDLTEVEMPDP